MKPLITLFALLSITFLIRCTEYSPIDGINSQSYLEIINPQNNSNVPDSTTIRISTNIENLIRVELYIDHNIPSEEAIFKNSPYKYLWFTSFYHDGSQHILQAIAYNSDGNSIESKFVIVNVYRFQPSSLVAYITSDSLIELNWIDNSSYETGFEIEEAINDSNFIKIAEVDSNETNYTLSGAFSQSDKYYFRIRAKSANEYSGYSNIAKAMVRLNAPNNLNIEFISDTAATLKWNDNNDFETSYVIGKQVNNYGYITIKEVGANITETVIEDTFVSGQYYNYSIYAKMGYLTGEPAHFPYVNFEFPPPHSLFIDGLNEHSLKLNWEEENNYELGFIVEKSQDGVNFLEIGRTVKNHITFTDNNLDTTLNYYYRLAAYSHFNQSQFTDLIQAHYSSQLNPIKKFQIISIISWMTVSYDASVIAFGGYTSNNLDVAIYIYDTFTGQLVRTINSADSTSRIFEDITISPDNSLIAAAGDNGYITVWNLNTGTVVKRINSIIHPGALKFSYDGNYLIAVWYNTVRFYNIQTWQYDIKISNPNLIYLMDTDPSQNVIATSDRQSDIKLWNYGSGSYIRDIPSTLYTQHFNLNDEGTRIYVVSNYNLYCWGVYSGEIVLTIEDFYADRDFAMCENKDIIAGSLYSSGVGLWELSSGNHVQNFVASNESASDLVFTNDNTFLIGRVSNSSYRIWDIKRKWVSPIK